MTTGQFADLVFAMRKAQKEYFKTRSAGSLRLSKELEKEVDDALKARQARESDLAKQGSLFGA